MATVVVYLIIKVYWGSTSSQGDVTLTHNPPQDGHRGLEHHDDHIGGFSLHEDTYPYPGQGPGQDRDDRPVHYYWHMGQLPAAQ